MNHRLTQRKDPNVIGIFDVRAPTRTNITQGSGRLAGFMRTSIANEGSVITGFTKPWPPAVYRGSATTVFCTAATPGLTKDIPHSFPSLLRSVLPVSSTLSRDHLAVVLLRFSSSLPLVPSWLVILGSSLLRGSLSHSSLPRSCEMMVKDRRGQPYILLQP